MQKKMFILLIILLSVSCLSKSEPEEVFQESCELRMGLLCPEFTIKTAPGGLGRVIMTLKNKRGQGFTVTTIHYFNETHGIECGKEFNQRVDNWMSEDFSVNCQIPYDLKGNTLGFRIVVNGYTASLSPGYAYPTDGYMVGKVRS